MDRGRSHAAANALGHVPGDRRFRNCAYTAHRYRLTPDNSAMQVAIAGRLAPAALIVALPLLAGCGTGGGGVAAGTSTSAKASTVASTSAKPSSVASTPPTKTPTAAASTPRAAQTPSALLDSALSAMLPQQSAHLACTISSSAGDQAESEDIGTSSGRIVNTTGSVSTSNILVGGLDYFSTNTPGVLTISGISEAEA